MNSPTSDGTSVLLARIADLERRNKRLRDRVYEQRRRAEMWRERAMQRARR